MITTPTIPGYHKILKESNVDSHCIDFFVRRFYRNGSNNEFNISEFHFYSRLLLDWGLLSPQTKKIYEKLFHLVLHYFYGVHNDNIIVNVRGLIISHIVILFENTDEVIANSAFLRITECGNIVNNVKIVWLETISSFHVSFDLKYSFWNGY
jgi:hypothetical protein